MKVKDMCLCAMFALLIGIGAFIKLPISIVPITLQTLFVMMASLFLRTKAVYSVLLYVGMGLLGLPILTNGGGLAYILMPSFGYLIGFIVCSLYVGRFQKDNYISLLIRSCIGMMIIYVIGMLYFAFIQYVYYGQDFSIAYIITTLFLVYLPGDLLSVIVAVIAYQRIHSIIPHHIICIKA